jgi:hypothetical protein
LPSSPLSPDKGGDRDLHLHREAAEVGPSPFLIFLFYFILITTYLYHNYSSVDLQIRYREMYRE